MQARQQQEQRLERLQPDQATQLASFPPEIQRYMQAEGFTEPTPIQERCAQLGIVITSLIMLSVSDLAVYAG